MVACIGLRALVDHRLKPIVCHCAGSISENLRTLTIAWVAVTVIVIVRALDQLADVPSDPNPLSPCGDSGHDMVGEGAVDGRLPNSATHVGQVCVERDHRDHLHDTD